MMSKTEQSLCSILCCLFVHVDFDVHLLEGVAQNLQQRRWCDAAAAEPIHREVAHAAVGAVQRHLGGAAAQLRLAVRVPVHAARHEVVHVASTVLQDHQPSRTLTCWVMKMVLGDG